LEELSDQAEVRLRVDRFMNISAVRKSCPSGGWGCHNHDEDTQGKVHEQAERTRSRAIEFRSSLSAGIAFMTDRSVVIQIQGMSGPLVVRSADNLVSCVAMLAPGDAWHVEEDVAEDWCNIRIRSPHPVALWRKILALLSDDLSSLRVLEDRWIVICEGRRGWDDYRTLAHFARRKKLAAVSPR
jgi:hypothetical protein